MARMALATLLGLIIVSSSRVSLAEENYFSDGKEQLTFNEGGERSHTEKVLLLSLAGAAVVSGAVGAYFARDSQTRSDEVSATQFHTGQAWSQGRQSIYDDALGSRRIALVSLGMSASLVAATIVTYLVTDPDEKVGYENWQTRALARPTKGGFIVGQGWTF